MTIYKAENKK